MIRILNSGEQAVVVEFGAEIDPGVNARVHRLARILADLSQRAGGSPATPNSGLTERDKTRRCRPGNVAGHS